MRFNAKISSSEEGGSGRQEGTQEARFRAPIDGVRVELARAWLVQNRHCCFAAKFHLVLGCLKDQACAVPFV